MPWQLGVPDISSGLAQGISGAGRSIGGGLEGMGEKRRRDNLLKQAGTVKDLGNGYLGVLDGRGGVQVIEKPRTYSPQEMESLRGAGYTMFDGKPLPIRERETAKVVPTNEKIVDPESGKAVGFYDQAGRQVLYPQRDETSAGKQLTAEQAKRISDLINVKSALPGLMQGYNKIKDNWTTGPLMGRTPLASAVGANDPDIQNLEAQLDQITPSLARGVFGEVGVLTDADVKRYRALLPSRLHNEKVANELFKSLSGKVDSTLQNVLEANRDAGYDVSGFGKYLPQTTAPAPSVPSTSTPAPAVEGGQRAAALQWAAQHPNDPRAAEIKRRLGAP